MKSCINTEEKVCFFGFGGIAVNVCCQTIIFKEIAPPKGAGNRLFEEDGTKDGEWDYTGNEITVSFSNIEDIKKMLAMINLIETTKNGSFVFRGVTFDFNEYKQESLYIVKKAVEKVRTNLISLMTC